MRLRQRQVLVGGAGDLVASDCSCSAFSNVGAFVSCLLILSDSAACSTVDAIWRKVSCEHTVFDPITNQLQFMKNKPFSVLYVKLYCILKLYNGRFDGRMKHSLYRSPVVVALLRQA